MKLFDFFAATSLALTPEAPLLPAYTSSQLAETYEIQDPQYVDCIRLIARDLEIGRIGAQQWSVEGGGAAAQHCLAVADLAAGFPKLAAVRLTELAARQDAGSPETRALILGQAALAWLDATDPAEAAATVRDAQEIIARNKGPLPELTIVAAKVFAANDEWQAVVEAVDEAEEAGMATPEAYVLRGRANMALAKDSQAADDVVKALKLEPFDLDALVLRGELIQKGIPINMTFTPSQLDAASELSRQD